ncbi:hypothetical protein EUGRSUZ_L03219 [Eucalyptus grandis]|uniref:Uncharacterized protein n=1 Tax=Eucalyptus grandis TaxID=71139 RepID=A0AAD9T8M7_EUCGR|nr:hypothetical protein EUGRSUZ_L03219 [Eucalyptus grandis]
MEHIESCQLAAAIFYLLFFFFFSGEENCDISFVFFPFWQTSVWEKDCYMTSFFFPSFIVWDKNFHITFKILSFLLLHEICHFFFITFR